MKRIFILFWVLLPVIGQAQNFGWITPNQTYLKMFICKDGIYRINKSDFTNAGISTSSIDPRTVKVYYKGNQIPIYFFGENDGTFDDTDWFDFFGQRNYGGLTNTYTEYNVLAYTTDEYYNLYSDTSAYWIGWNGAYGLRYTDYLYSTSTPYPDNYYMKRLHFESDAVYSLGINDNSGSDYRNFSNDKFLGEGWYWKTMLFQNLHTQTFTLSTLQTSAPTGKFKIFMQPITFSSTVSNEHCVAVKLNNNLIDTLKAEDLNRIDTTEVFSNTFLVNGTNTLSIRYAPPSAFGSSAQIYLDNFDIYYPSKFQFDSNEVYFSNLTSDTTSRLFTVSGYVASNPLVIYDYKYGYRITNYTVSGDAISFTGKSDGSYRIVNKNITLKPNRIKQKSVPNLVSNSTGADWIIVYNKLFETQAEQLRAFRTSNDGFRTFKAEIEDIYDIFNYGMEDPVAVRYFLKNAYNNWATPKLSYVCLLGRGSLDPKGINNPQPYYQNLVPLYGNPYTDGYFANFNFNSFTYYHQIGLGRLPAYTVQEAQNMVDKIIAYASTPLDKWTKTSLFLSGGYTASDQQQDASRAEYLATTYLTPPPLSDYLKRVYLTDSTGAIKYNYKDSIINSINQGAIYLNYNGHSGNTYWDFSFDDPSVLNNGSRQPLIISATCFTGKAGEPSWRGFGEKFLIQQNKGAIGFISTSGWSFSLSGSTFNEYCLMGMKNNGYRRFGDIVKYASSSMSPDSSSFPVKNTINCYNLIGDPATKLLQPAHPEFNITAGDFTVSNNQPSLRENINLKVFPKNLGTYADSCKLRFQILKNQSAVYSKDTILRAFGFIDTINYYFHIDTTGNYTAKVTLDPDNWYPADNKTDNISSVSIVPKTLACIPLKPLDNQIVYNDTVTIVGVNPQVNLYGNSVKIMLQVDTSSAFNSPMLLSYFNNNPIGVTTKFNVPITNPDTNIVYLWRFNCILNNTDSTGWTAPRRFSISSGSVPDSVLTIRKADMRNYSPDELLFTTFYDNNSIKLNNFKGSLMSSSYGGNPWDPTYFYINSKAYYFFYSNNEGYAGVYMAKISKVDGRVNNMVHIYMMSSTSNDSVVNFLNSVDTNHILAVVKTIPLYITQQFNAAAISAFHNFGSTKVDSVNLISWGTWSFISYNNPPLNTVSEAYNAGYVPSNSYLYPDFRYPTGSVQNLIGPADKWNSFNWTSVIYPSTNLKFDVFGINRSNQQIKLASDLTSSGLVSLDTVNAYTYPYLSLVSKLSFDTTQTLAKTQLTGGTPSPLLKSLYVRYNATADLAVNYSSFVRSDSVITDKDSIGVYASYSNIGYKKCYGVIRNWYFYRNNDKVIVKSDTVNQSLAPDSSSSIKTYLKFTGLQLPVRRFNEPVLISFEVLPLASQNEIYTYNNSITFPVIIKSSTSTASLNLYADGVLLQSGDFVKKTPELTFRYDSKENQEVPLYDTTLFKVYINDILYNTGFSVTERSTANTKSIDSKSISTKADNEKHIALTQISLKPQLNDGKNRISILHRFDPMQFFDSTNFVVEVSGDLRIKDLSNFPNPMRNMTTFMFNLSGLDVKSCKVKIYTVAGRLIKTINASANIGFNQIFWDGRDDDGDALANGVYLYKVIIDGEGKTETNIQKLVILK
jgi:hypothetical protein